MLLLFHLMDPKEVCGRKLFNADNYVQMRGREYRFFSDHILCLETRAYFFFSHNLFRPPHEPILFLSPVLHQKSGTKDKKATKEKKKHPWQVKV